MALADKYYTIGVLGKSFGVIELMAHQAKWELRDLAKASGLPKGTLQRILLTLCELGFEMCIRDRHGRFCRIQRSVRGVHG